MVSGSSLYKIKINIKPLKPAIWKAIKTQCSGQIGSMLELLQGRLSDQVMSIVTDQKKGLLPLPGQIALGCNCPDWAEMCKHLAAVLYGVGHRLDQQPDLLFTLRGVDAKELITGDISLPDSTAATSKTIADDQLADIFGVDIDMPKKKVIKAKMTGRKKKPEKHTTTKLPQIRPTDKSIVRLRTQLKLSVSQFAERLGVTPASIYRWEKTPGRLKLQPHTYKALAQLHQHREM